ncbi:MAG: DUF402 domain-containing protein [Nonomuraea sp.]|nr:DUF402 domain-containing protein [Nonomuraea sp.]
MLVGMNLYIGGHLSMGLRTRLVERTPEGALLWLPMGTPMWRAVLPDGGHLRDVLPERRPPGGYPVREGTWKPRHNLVYQPADAGYAVWWGFSADLTFRGWYVNLERRVVRDGAIDVLDHDLDLLIDPDGAWQWKDEDTFTAKIGHPAYWSRAEADRIRGVGEHVLALARRGAFPFDGRWCDFRPDPDWTIPSLPPRPETVRTSSCGRSG